MRTGVRLHFELVEFAWGGWPVRSLSPQLDLRFMPVGGRRMPGIYMRRSGVAVRCLDALAELLAIERPVGS